MINNAIVCIFIIYLKEIYKGIIMQTIHINLISEQLIPNLVPTLSDSNCKGVVLVLGDSTLSDRAERLEYIYSQRGVDVVKHMQGKSSFKLSDIKCQAKELIDFLKNNHSDKRWVLNATCGTKPMALTFTSAFNEYNATLSNINDSAFIIYTDSQNKEIPLLNDGIEFSLPYKSELTIDEILAANGFMIMSEITKNNDDDIIKRKDLTEYLSNKLLQDCIGMLGTLQAMATEASKDFPNNKVQSMRKEPISTYAQVYNKLNENGLISWDSDTKTIIFNSEDACRYLAGRWLEEMTYLTALKCGFEEVAMSVEGVWGDKYDLADAQKDNRSLKGKNNEFDILIRTNNQLLTIECKARNWSANSQGVNESTQQDVMHKLDNLGRKLGGLFGLNVLVSVYSLTPAMIERAKSNRINVLDNINLDKMRQYLKDLNRKMS